MRADGSPVVGIRVLIVDDHPMFRAGIRERLESGGDSIVVVGEAADGSHVRDLVAELSPDVVLMDISMPTMNGIDATRLIHAEFPKVDIVILSVYDDGQYVHAALAAGASGYLLKTVEASELREAVVRVAAGESALSPAIARTVLTRISNDAARPSALSERERQILELVAQGSSNKAIGKELFLSTRTVEAHMRNIFDKLEVSSRTEAVTQAVAHQWIRLPDAN
jgi:DNA-binding NarL/FixJ family response regulator